VTPPRLRSLALARRAPAAAAALACIALQLTAPCGALAGDWLTLSEETDTRLIADPSVGTEDFEEKDYDWGDVDKDGDMDLVVARKQPFTTAGKRRNVLFMNEEGVLVDRSDTLAPDFLDVTNDRDIKLVDVDGDTWLDVVTATTFQEQPRILMNLGEVGGQWQGLAWDPARLPLLETPAGIGPHFCGLGVGDINGDNRPDLYFADYGGIIVGEGNDLNDRVLINDATNPGFFLDQTDARTDPSMIQSCFGTQADVADMNGDGFPDVVKTTGVGSAPPGVGCPQVSILYNDGTGVFDFQDAVYTGAPYHAAVADFTHDDRLDIFAVDDGQDAYLVNQGNDAQDRAIFTTTDINPPATSGFGGNVTFADMNGDDDLDVLIADVDVDLGSCGSTSRNLWILRGTGAGFADGPNDRWAGPQNTNDMAPIDINGDGALDLVAGSCQSGMRIFMGFSSDIFADGFESGDTSAWDSTVP
jgi:hypothetical protein